MQQPEFQVQPLKIDIVVKAADLNKIRKAARPTKPTRKENGGMFSAFFDQQYEAALAKHEIRIAEYIAIDVTQHKYGRVTGAINRAIAKTYKQLFREVMPRDAVVRADAFDNAQHSSSFVLERVIAADAAEAKRFVDQVVINTAAGYRKFITVEAAAEAEAVEAAVIVEAVIEAEVPCAEAIVEAVAKAAAPCADMLIAEATVYTDMIITEAAAPCADMIIAEVPCADMAIAEAIAEPTVYTDMAITEPTVYTDMNITETEAPCADMTIAEPTVYTDMNIAKAAVPFEFTDTRDLTADECDDLIQMLCRPRAKRAKTIEPIIVSEDNVADDPDELDDLLRQFIDLDPSLEDTMRSADINCEATGHFLHVRVSAGDNHELANAQENEHFTTEASDSQTEKNACHCSAHDPG